MDFWKSDEYGIEEKINLNKYGMSIFALKIIAVVTMFIDHFALLFCGDNEKLYLMLRSVGRMSFPLFAFVLTEGFFHTKNRMSYAIRLGVFALISEVPYDMMYGQFFNMARQNVMFTLFIGFMTIWALDIISGFGLKYPEQLLRYIGGGRINAVLEFVIILLGLGMAYFINSSYAHAGVLLIICFYVFRKHHIGRMISNMVFNMGMFGFGIQWWGVLSIIPIAMYNGTPGIRRGKYFFYWFYPLHIAVLILLKRYNFLI